MSWDVVGAALCYIGAVVALRHAANTDNPRKGEAVAVVTLSGVLIFAFLLFLVGVS